MEMMEKSQGKLSHLYGLHWCVRESLTYLAGDDAGRNEIYIRG